MGGEKGLDVGGDIRGEDAKAVALVAELLDDFGHARNEGHGGDVGTHQAGATRDEGGNTALGDFEA